jgi:hypothetical protein
MTQRTLSAATTDLLETYGKTAHNVIEAYRVGGERVAGFVDQRWSMALDGVGARLATDVRLNALSAQRKVTSLYTRGVRFSTGSADAVVHKAVSLATQGVRQAAAGAEQIEHLTGITRLGQVAGAALPAVAAVQRVASQLEVRSHRLAKRIAGRATPVQAAEAAPTTQRRTSARKSRARKAV